MDANDSDEKLLPVAEALGDGQPIDWDGLAAREPEIAKDLQGLKAVAKVAAAYRRQVAPEAEGQEKETVTVPDARRRARASRHWIVIAAVAAALLALAMWLARSAQGALPPGTRPERPRVQAAPRIYDATPRMDVNNLDLPTTNYGVVALAPPNFGLIYPKGSGLSALFDAGIWIGGKVLGGPPRVTVAAYSQEYAPGTLSSDPNDPRFRSYKLTREDSTSADYLSWPVQDGAPVDSLGKPGLVGDAMIWSVFNDGDPTHHADLWGRSPPLDMEVRQSTFAFSRNGPLNDIIFLRWKLRYRGVSFLDSAYVSLFGDVDLGDYRDDLAGCDTTLALGYCYNAAPFDSIYGSNPPAVGLIFLKGPDKPALGGGTDTLGMTSFATDLATLLVDGAGQSFQLMRGFHPDGTPIHEFDNPGGTPTSFELTGDPVTGTGWLDGAPGDQKFLMTSGPFQMAVGDTQEIVAALIVGRGPDRLASVQDLRSKAEVARQVYADHFLVPGTPIASLVAPAYRAIGIHDSLHFDVQVLNPGTASYSIRADSLPAGAVFHDRGDNTGAFEWDLDPKAFGNYLVPFTAIGTAGDTLRNQTRIEVAVIPHPPRLSQPSDMVVNEGSVATQVVSATDPDEGDHLRFSMVSGPTFVTLETNDSLSLAGSVRVRAAPGPLEHGNYSVTLEVTDDFYYSDQRTFAVTVLAVPHAPTLSVPASIEGTEGQRLRFSCSAFDPDGSDTLRLTATGVPAPLVFSAETETNDGSVYAFGVVQGTPTAADVGAHLIQWSVSDGVLPAVAATTALTISARDVSPAPVLLASRYLAYGLPGPPSGMVSGEWNGDPAPGLAILQQDGALSFLGSDGQGLFTPRTDTFLGAGPGTLSRADFNHDGVADVLVWDLYGGSVFIGSSSGSFTRAASFTISGGLVQAAVADINDDQIEDVIAVNRSGIVSFFIGAGNGTLQSPYTIPLSVHADGLLAQDLDGDGHVDLMIADSYQNTISIFPGSGGELGGEKFQFVTVNGPRSLGLSDMNGDGRLDIVVLGSSASLAVHLGTGRFTYRMMAPVSTGGSGYGAVLAIGDANGDGHPDVAVASAGKVSLFLGGGDGGFLPRTVLGLPASAYPTALACEDFTSDGRVDLAVALSVGEFSVGGIVALFPGPFDAPVSAYEYETVHRPGLPVVADVNRDGHSDVLVPGYDRSDTLDIFLGDGRGHLTRIAPVTGASFGFMAAGDFDGDGRLDLAAHSSSPSGDSSAVSIFSGHGDGTFERRNEVTLPMAIASLASRDLNGDGREDLIVSEYRSFPMDGARLEAYLARADGTFERRDGIDLDHAPVLVQTADLNRDGHIDIVALGFLPNSSAVVTFLGRGDGTFAPGSSYALSSWVWALTVADVDLDGIPDVIAGTERSITILHGVGDGTWGPIERHDADPGAGIAVSDFDGDGALDFAVAEADWGAVALYTRRSNGGYLARGSYGNGAAASMATGDFNEDGSPDLAVSEDTWDRLALLLNEGPAAPAATTSRAEADSGVITVAWYIGEGVSGPATLYRAVPAGSWASLRSMAIPADRVVSFTDSTAAPGQTYRYRVGVWKGGMETFSSEVVLGLPSVATAPRAVALRPATPNPFRGSTSIPYSLPRAGPVRIRVFDVAGRQVAVLMAGAAPAGEHAVVWNGRDSRGRDAGSGIYFVKLDAEGQSRVRKIALTR